LLFQPSPHYPSVFPFSYRKQGQEKLGAAACRMTIAQQGVINYKLNTIAALQSELRKGGGSEIKSRRRATSHHSVLWCPTSGRFFRKVSKAQEDEVNKSPCPKTAEQKNENCHSPEPDDWQQVWMGMHKKKVWPLS
jgi:hypothetical protein